MQSKSVIFLFLLVIAMPVFILSSNHEIFFVVTSLVILVLSIRNLARHISGKTMTDNEPDEELESELEEMIDIDIKRFGTGIKVINNLIVILFLIYSAFFLESFILKIICTAAILLQIHFIFKKTEKSGAALNPDRYKFLISMASLLNIAVIIFAFLNKLEKLK